MPNTKQIASALEISGLTKRFDRLTVNRLDLTVRSGEFYALSDLTVLARRQP
jgi:ABC-2 type transport system ATP-binding protein